MTRKRFVKVLMALGCEPRYAQSIARVVNGAGIPYARGFWSVLAFVTERGAEKYGKLIVLGMLSRLVCIGKLPGLEVPHE